MRMIQDFEPTDPTEIIPGILPADVVIIAGVKGTGKSQIALRVASAVTDGEEFVPGHKARARGKAVLFNGEREAQSVAIPRAIAAGIKNPKRTLIMPVVASLEEAVQALLVILIEHPNIKLVIIDPLNAYLDGKSPTNAKARKLLAPLLDLCTRRKLCVLIVTHFTKAGEISGSAGWTQAACSIWRAAPIKDGGILEHTTCNVLDTRGQCWEYALETVALDPKKYKKRTIPITRALITGKSEIDFDTAMKEGKDTSSTMPHRCAQAIEDFLRDGPQDRNLVLRHLDQLGLGERHTVKRAQELLQGRLIYTTKGRTTIWSIQLPPETDMETEEVYHG